MYDRRLRACVAVADVADAVTVCVPCEASLPWVFWGALYFAITDIAAIGMLGACVADVVAVVFLTRSVCSGTSPTRYIRHHQHRRYRFVGGLC